MKESKEGYMGGFGGRRGKGRLCNYSVLSKDKKFKMAVNFHIFMGFLPSDFFMLLISNSIPLCFKMTFFCDFRIFSPCFLA